MSLIQDKWRNWECRIEDGVFFSNDEYIGLSFDAVGLTHATARVPIQTLIDEEPDGWADIDAACECSNDQYTVMGGGGSWEGEGWVAVVEKANHQLKWLLHLSDSEAVTELAIEGETVKAVATEYPFRSTLKIPMTKPEALSMIREQ